MIPKTINYIFGVDKDFCGKPFLYFHYLNILSAHECNPTYTINVYYKYKPDSIHFDALSEFCNVNHVDIDYDISFSHKEHIGDLFRLNLLYDDGGIYLDTDVVCVNSFDSFLGHDVVMGEERTSDGNFIGLCNATILSKRASPFIHEWIDTYYSDYKSEWNYNSVQVPAKISMYMQNYIRIESMNSFFKYSWDQFGTENIFNNNSLIDGCYCLHLWESKNYKRLIKYDIDYIKNNNDTLSNIYKKLL